MLPVLHIDSGEWGCVCVACVYVRGCLFGKMSLSVDTRCYYLCIFVSLVYVFVFVGSGYVLPVSTCVLCICVSISEFREAILFFCHYSA